MLKPDHNTVEMISSAFLLGLNVKAKNLTAYVTSEGIYFYSSFKDLENNIPIKVFKYEDYNTPSNPTDCPLEEVFKDCFRFLYSYDRNSKKGK